MLVAEVPGQLRYRSSLEERLRVLTQQTTRPDQAHALLLRLREQPLGKIPLINDLSTHGVNDLAANDDSGGT